MTKTPITTARGLVEEEENGLDGLWDFVRGHTAAQRFAAAQDFVSGTAPHGADLLQAPGVAGSALAAAGYDPAIDKGQWNIAAMYGPKAQAILKQFNGQGVHIGLYDDGIDKTSAAVMAHYDASRELTISGVKADPGLLAGNGQGVHGTATAGLLVADAGRTGGQMTGLAYGAGLTAVNIFSGAASGTGMLAAIAQMSRFDVTSNSWGWSAKWADRADLSGSFGRQLIANLTAAATTGRGGLGTVIVKAAGNDWFTDHRDANTQEFNADRHVITVGAVGQNGTVAFYSQRGASVLVSAYSSGGGAGILTTDRTGAAGYAAGDLTSTFGGTSAATPQVAAVVADMLSANARLGARDVQAILALAARDTESAVFTTARTGNMAYGFTVNAARTVNGGGYHVSNDVGFGTLNAHDAIREAEVWSYFEPAPQTFANELRLSASAAGKAVPATGTGASFSFTVGGGMTVESVALALTVTTKNLDAMKVVLTDPYGNRSILLDASQTLAGETGNAASGLTWTLGSQAFRGEIPAGTWTAAVTDPKATDGLVVSAARLDVFGASAALPHVFHYTDEALMMQADNPARKILSDPGTSNAWIDTAAMTGTTRIDLRAGATSTVDGRAFLTLAQGTTINRVTLGDGAATVTANNNGDTVVAGHGFATIAGGTGADTLVAGYGGARMTGGAGADVFAFGHDGFGTTTITDFVRGVDTIDLRGLHDLWGSLRITETAAQTLITGLDGAGDAIALLNMGNQRLTASDFLFA